MNDVEFILKEDIKEKKQAGRGYYHKKNGSKSKLDVVTATKRKVARARTAAFPAIVCLKKKLKK